MALQQKKILKPTKELLLKAGRVLEPNSLNNWLMVLYYVADIDTVVVYDPHQRKERSIEEASELFDTATIDVLVPASKL